MGMKNITAGTREAKVIAGRFIESKSGKSALELCFEFKEPSTQTEERLYYQAWLTDAAMPHSMKMLVEVLGYQYSEEVDADGLITKPDTFTDKPVSIVIEMQNRKEEDGVTDKLDDNGNVIQDPRIKYVNKLGGSSYVGMDALKVKSMLKATGFKASFLAATKSAGTPAKKESSKNPPADNGSEDVPW